MNRLLLIASISLFSLGLFHTQCAAQVISYAQPFSGQTFYSPVQRMQYPYGNTHLWNNSQILRQLELTREQRRELIELKMDFEDQTYELNQELNRARYPVFVNNNGTAEPVKASRSQPIIQGEIQKIVDEFHERANEILLPHQQSLVERMKLKNSIQNQRLYPLVSGRMKKFLGLSDQQQKRIKEIAAAEQEKMEEQLIRMFREVERRTMRELTREQKEQFIDLVGDKTYGPRKSPQANWIFSLESSYYQK